MKKLLLLDGNSLVYRAFFALSQADMRTSNGDPTGAIYGFLTMLFTLMKDHQPDGLAVAFDLPQASFRHERVETYNAGRAKTHDDLLEQLPKIKEILPSMGIQTIELKGYEADDIIGTVAKNAEKNGFEVYMVTPDKDFAQLVTENIFLYKLRHYQKKILPLFLPSPKRFQIRFYYLLFSYLFHLHQQLL
mgnify:CR=1 FL=1